MYRFANLFIPLFGAGLFIVGAIAFAQTVTTPPDPDYNRAHRTPPSIDPQRYSGGDGHSLQEAVIVLSHSHPEAVAAEFDWVKFYHQGAKVTGQTFAAPQGGHRYDVMTLEGGGPKRELWFDVTASTPAS
jgi:hypothetical protein